MTTFGSRDPGTPDDLHHLAAAYALDALDPDERRRFEAHYPGCEICWREVDDFRATAAVLAEASGVAPPPDLKARIMADVGRTRQLSPIGPERVADLADRRRPGRVGAILAGAAAAVLLIVVGGVAGIRLAGGGDDIGEVAIAPDALVGDLTGEDGTIRLIWSAERDEVALVAEGLDDPGPGRVYELWFLLPDGVAPAGLFTPDDDGVLRTVLAVDDIEGGGFGVTIEPEGGSSEPTLPVLYAVEF